MSSGMSSEMSSGTSQTYLSSGARLGYSDSGAGLPVVFLHPTPLDRDYWRPLVARLSGLRAVIPDLRGHGVSELGSGLGSGRPIGLFARVPDAPALTMAQLGNDILALLDHLGLQSAVFVGCSIGGYAMLELWRRAPQRMKGLAFICSKPQPDAEANLEKRAATIAQARAGEKAKVFDGNALNLVGATTRGLRPEIVAEVRARMTLTAEALVAVQAGLAVRPDSVPAVATITAPVLAIAGGEDVAVTTDDMKAFAAARGGCEYHLLADAGHFAAYEQPERVAAIMNAWMQRFAA
jgi:pimeloyl-ACP methyl ester carboxylesterase